MERVEFLVPLPPSALRPNRRAQHWAPRAKAADEYSAQIAEEWLVWTGGRPRGWRAASVTYIWRYAGKRPDIDNIAGAIKVLQDTLCTAPKNGGPGRDRWYLGIIRDDGDIDPVTFKRAKVATRKEEGIWVQIERRQG